MKEKNNSSSSRAYKQSDALQITGLQCAFSSWRQHPVLYFALISEFSWRPTIHLLENWSRHGRHSIWPSLPSVWPHWCCILLLLVITGSGRFRSSDLRNHVLICQLATHHRIAFALTSFAKDASSIMYAMKVSGWLGWPKPWGDKKYQNYHVATRGLAGRRKHTSHV